MFLVNCRPKPTYYEQMYDAAFSAIKDDIKTRLVEAEKYARIGNRDEAQKRYDQVNNWYYLIYFLTLLLMDYSDAINRNDVSVTMESLLEKYSITCIRDRFICDNMNIDLVLKVFGIGLSYDSGISIMRIDGDAIPFTPHPIDEKPL